MPRRMPAWSIRHRAIPDRENEQINAENGSRFSDGSTKPVRFGDAPPTPATRLA